MTPSKYLLTPPEDLHSLGESKPKIYPDFDPWIHTKEEDKILKDYVAKGFYNTSRVNFETISARSALQESLPKVSKFLGEELTKIIQIREQEINRLGTFDKEVKFRFSKWAGQDFQLPTRVTLTDQKRNQWLQELSSSSSSMQKLTRSVPHGFRKRHILEQCYMQMVPIARAIWLIKSCYAIEWNALNASSKTDDNQDILDNLYKEWTDNMVLILEKLIYEMSKYYNDASQLRQWKLRTSYYLNVIGNCYEMQLLNKAVLLQWIVEFLGKIESFELYPISLHILSIFWSELMETTNSEQNSQFLLIKLSEILLRKYHIVSESKCMINDSRYIINDVQKNFQLKETILLKLRRFIYSLFHTQSLETFIMPKQNWTVYKNYLYQILLQNTSGADVERSKKKLDLISYRNESMRLGSLNEEPFPQSSPDNPDTNLEKMFNKNILNLKHVSPDLILLLDSGPPNNEWNVYVDQRMNRVEQIVEIIFWCIHPSRKFRYDNCHLVAKILVLKLNSQDIFQESSVEDIIWSLIFYLSKLSKSELYKILWLPKLYQLLNVFINYGIVKVSTYIRKLISSGIFYLPESKNKNFLCNLLINLKISPVMKSQYNLVLKNVSENAAHFYVKFNFDKLTEMFEELKTKILSDELDDLDKYPGSVKTMCSEWYLSHICFNQPELEKATREEILKKFEIFVVKFDEVHHFLNWAECIIYHRSLADIQSLELFIDILLYLSGSFCLLINDHILFMKTLLHTYLRDLRYREPILFELLSFKTFWKFFVSNFSAMVEMDSSLQSQIAEAFELERIRHEKFLKNPSDIKKLYVDINGPKSGKLEDQNFPGILQQNLKKILHSAEEKTTSRMNLLLCKIVNPSDYTKFLSIFIKRGDFSTEEVIQLVALKICTLEIVQKATNTDLVCDVLSRDNFEFGLGFQNEKKTYVRRNLKQVAMQLSGKLPLRYTLVKFLVQFGVDSRTQMKVSNVIQHILDEEKTMSIIEDILMFGIIDEEITARNSLELYKYLNFTNTWIFQILTEYQIKSSTSETIESFFTNLIDIVGCNSLFSKIFANVSTKESMVLLLNHIEKQFLVRIRNYEPKYLNFVKVLMETAIIVSRKYGSSTTLQLDTDLYALFKDAIKQFSTSTDQNDIHLYYEPLNELLKMVVIHEKFILKACFQDTISGDHGLLQDFYTLFEKTGKDLKLKLMLYDILTSLKSYIIHQTSLKKGAYPKLPKILNMLPKFTISSFLDSESPEEDIVNAFDQDMASLGLQTSEFEESQTNHFFVFNKKNKQFDCPLHIEPFQLLVNYQEPSAEKLNNTSLSLSLFDARIETTNPS